MHAVHWCIYVVWCLYICPSVFVTSLCFTEFSRNFAPSAFSTVAGRSSGRTFPLRHRGRFDRTPSGAAFLCQYCSTSLLLHKVFSVLIRACERRWRFLPPYSNLLMWLIPNETVWHINRPHRMHAAHWCIDVVWYLYICVCTNDSIASLGY